MVCNTGRALTERDNQSIKAMRLKKIAGSKYVFLLVLLK
jgi:hypothetical protein